MDIVNGLKQRIKSPFPLLNRMKEIYFLPPDLLLFLQEMSTPYLEDSNKRSSASFPGPWGVGIERDMQTIPWFIATEDTLKGNHNRGSFSNSGNQSPRLLDPPHVLHSLCKYLLCPCNNIGSWWEYQKCVMHCPDYI